MGEREREGVGEREREREREGVGKERAACIRYVWNCFSEPNGTGVLCMLLLSALYCVPSAELELH